MNALDSKSFRHQSKAQLVKEIEETKTLSQLFALIQKEQIHIQMHAQSDASSVNPRKLVKLTAQDIIRQKDTPFERLKAEVYKAVSERDD